MLAAARACASSSSSVAICSRCSCCARRCSSCRRWMSSSSFFCLPRSSSRSFWRAWAAKVAALACEEAAATACLPLTMISSRSPLASAASELADATSVLPYSASADDAAAFGPPFAPSAGLMVGEAAGAGFMILASDSRCEAIALTNALRLAKRELLAAALCRHSRATQASSWPERARLSKSRLASKCAVTPSSLEMCCDPAQGCDGGRSKK